MATEGDENGQGDNVAEGTKIVLALILFPLLPFAVAFNVLGIANRFSFLPGIGRGGGAVAGVVALVYVGAVVGVAAGGGVVATGADVPFIGDSDDPAETTPISTPEPTPTVTQPSTLEPTPTVTPTPEPEPTPEPGNLEAFEAGYQSRLDNTMHNETLTGVPVLATDYRENDEGQLELWVVFWECDFAQSETDQWLTLGADFVNTVGPHEGEQPDRLRVYSVTNLTNFEDEITYISTSSAEATYNGTMSVNAYTEEWWDRKREPTQVENETAYRMVINESGQETADEAFYNDHADDDAFKCNGGARPGAGSDDREEHDENTNGAVDVSPIDAFAGVPVARGP